MILLVYAADDSGGQIMMVNSITRSGPSISTRSWEFTAEDSAKESARWKGVVEKLERYGLVEAANYKHQVLTVTDQGYKAAETAKEKWNSDTSKNPDEYLER